MEEKLRGKQFLNVEDVASILGISKSMAYEYVKSTDCKFVCLQINSRLIIPVNSFKQWYDSLATMENEKN